MNVGKAKEIPFYLILSKEKLEKKMILAERNIRN